VGFDIYGNHLRPGYCEVHPDVPEYYPCRLCIMEKEQKDNPPPSVSRFKIFNILFDTKLSTSQKGDRIVALITQAGMNVK